MLALKIGEEAEDEANNWILLARLIFPGCGAELKFSFGKGCFEASFSRVVNSWKEEKLSLRLPVWACLVEASIRNWTTRASEAKETKRVQIYSHWRNASLSNVWSEVKMKGFSSRGVPT